MRLLLIALLIARGLCAQQPGSAPPRLDVVRTWGHLRAVEPVEWRDAEGAVHAARLGVERKKAAVGETVLVYGLFDGMLAPAIGDGALGPLVVRARRKPPRSTPIEYAFSAPSPPGRPVLHALAVPIDDDVVGIRVETGDGTVLAIDDWTVEGEAHPWMALDPHPDRPEVTDLGDHLEVQLASRASGRALPRWNGREPIPESPEVAGASMPRPDDEPLPTSRPQPDDRLRIRIDPDTPSTLRLESRAPLELTPPHRYLLFRFWVDGKPFVPPLAAEPTRSWSGRTMRSRTVQLTLDLDPADLGAEPGQTIGVQVLYTPAGWCWLGPDGAADPLMQVERDVDPRPAITQMEVIPVGR